MMDFSLQHHASFIGQHVSNLPTPALVISKSVVEQNIARLHNDVEATGLAFRPHVKTLKSLEVTRMMLGDGKHKKIVASTLAEIRGVLPLVEEGVLEEILYGLPIRPSALPELEKLRPSVRIALLIDHEQHVDLLESFGASAPWDVFIKLDVGSRRAGVPVDSPRLASLVQRVLSSSATSLFGFYCHAGHSYACRTQDEAEGVLQTEVDTVVQASGLVPRNYPLIVSIGATPTAHVIGGLKTEPWTANVTLELHAGNFPANDLQQVSTGLVAASHMAIRVVTEVCGVYPERNEALVNAGTIALSKETGGVFPGYGNVVGKPGWIVARMSQEHGILAWDDSVAEGTPTQVAEEQFHIGDKVFLSCAHSCITAAAFHAYYVVDDNEIVVETWVPWKGW